MDLLAPLAAGVIAALLGFVGGAALVARRRRLTAASGGAAVSALVPVRVRAYADFAAAVELFVVRMGVLSTQDDYDGDRALWDLEEVLARAHAAVRLLGGYAVVAEAEKAAALRHEIAEILLNDGGDDAWNDIEQLTSQRIEDFTSAARRELGA